MFSLLIALVLAVTVIIIPMFAPYNYILVLPSLLLLGESWSRLWTRDVYARAGCVLTAAAVAWPWVAAIGLSVAAMVLSPETVQQSWWLPLYTSAKIPLPIVCLIPLSILMVSTLQELKLPCLSRSARQDWWPEVRFAGAHAASSPLACIGWSQAVGFSGNFGDSRVGRWR